MRKSFVAVLAAGGLALATISTLQAQIAPPSVALPAAPPAVADPVLSIIAVAVEEREGNISRERRGNVKSGGG